MIENSLPYPIYIAFPTENVSEGKTAAQSETKAGNEARFAVDGVIDQQANYSYTMNKEDNSTVWWEVELGSVEKIHVIKVYFAEPGIDWSKSFIYVSNVMRKPVFGSFRPGKTQTGLLSYRS